MKRKFSVTKTVVRDKLYPVDTDPEDYHENNIDDVLNRISVEYSAANGWENLDW